MESMDCFVASLLAMTMATAKILRRQHRAPDQSALLQIDQRLVRPGEWHRRHWYRRDFFAADEIEQFLRLAEIADIAALDGDGLDPDQRQRPPRATAEQADDHELAALGETVEAELSGRGIADEIDHGADRSAGGFRKLLQRIGRLAVDGRERA